jgi:hypothetical protein
MPPQSTANSKTTPSRLANFYGIQDSIPFAFVDINQATSHELTRYLGLKPEIAERIVEARGATPVESLRELRSIGQISARAANRIQKRLVFAGHDRLHILDVSSRDEYLFSNKPFTLLVRFINPSEAPAALVSITVLWTGEPFVVEKEISSEEAEMGQVEVEFNSEQTLPVGQVEFRLALYAVNGAQASFTKSYFVLPSNPLSLSLGPAGATVTGTWSARGDYHGDTDTFLTECSVTVANGDASAVTLNRGVNWSFWDGGVGGTLVESGSFNWSGNNVVPAHGVLHGSIWFSSPHGSGIYNRYHDKEDMTLKFEMIANDGRHISDTITCRVMLAYGVNIIKVGDFGSQEHTDLYNSVDLMRQIYEKRDITLRGVLRWIIHNTDAGGFTVLDSESEFRDLLSDWSVPNDFVDVYVCQDFNWSSYNGYAGDIPGPASKGGNKDGVAVDKTGFTDGSGTARLNTDVLSKLIGHEVGHYLGLSHLEDTNNLMRSNTGNRGPDLNYDQYRKMFPHGFMVFE